MLSMLDLRWPEGPIGNWIKGIGVAFKSYGCLGAKVFFSWVSMSRCLPGFFIV
jgi:hypothetical protein